MRPPPLLLACRRPRALISSSSASSIAGGASGTSTSSSSSSRSHRTHPYLGRRALGSSAAAAAASSSSAGTHVATAIDMGDGVVDQIGAKHRQVIGPRTLVVCPRLGGPEEPHVQRVLARLRGVGIQCATFSMQERYPTTQAADEGATIAKRMGAQSIVGVGGGGVLDLAKAVAGLTLARGGCKEYLRVFHQEKELTTDRLPIVAVPTTASAGGGALGPQSLLLYEPEEALVPLWAKDLSPKVAVIDPSLTTTLAPPARRGMALAALSVAFDALACGSARGKDVLRGAGGGGGSGGDSMADLILAAARGVSAGLAAEGRPEVLAPGAQRAELAAGSVAAGRLLALVEAPPVQSLARCLAPLFPLASYSQLTAVLLRSYLAVLADRVQQGDVEGGQAFNERLLVEFAAAVLAKQEAAPPAEDAGEALMALAEWAWEESQRAGIRSLGDYRSLEKEEKTAEALATQVTSVLDLFQVEGGEALEAEVVRDVVEVALGT